MIQYTVKPGDNLTKIGATHNLSWKDLWQVNPQVKDPNMIKVGETIQIPVDSPTPGKTEVPPAGSLEKTLPPLDSPSPSPVKSLPETPQMDQLSLLKMALKKTSEMAYSSGVSENMKSVFKGLENQGIKPETIAGGSVGNIIDFIEQRTAKPIETQANTVLQSVTLAQQEQSRAKDDARSNLSQINNLISNSGKSWDQVPDELKKQIKDLELKAGMPEGIMEQFARSKPKANLLATTSGTDANGNEVISFVYADENGLPGVVKTVGTGQKSKTTPPSQKKITQTLRDKFYLPSDTTQEEFDLVNDTVRDYVKAVGGVNDQNRYKLWNEIATGLKSSDLNPTTYDALLWDYFHPERLTGYKKYQLGDKTIKEPKTKIQLDANAIQNALNNGD